MGLSSWGVRPPSTAFPLAYGCNPTYDETHWCNPDFDELIQQAQSTVDDDERANLYKQAEQLLSEDGGLINVLFFNSLHGMRANCSGFKAPVPFYQADFAPVECT
jgi:ABC-type transport system substrate-binding protein